MMSDMGMNCKQAEKVMLDFVRGEMDYKTLRAFDAHIQSCPSCHEELTIQFLVHVGLAKLEEGEAFDLQKSLEDQMARANKNGKMHNRIIYWGLGLEAFGIALMAGIILWMLL